ncbi:MAG: urea ABC transporter ATP-binding subunit UrtE [Gemmatimonadetes bacterium]|nr:urea ABC transporter ATP-binding subunit UrtE [Gemmatimonadota bacterium]
MTLEIKSINAFYGTSHILHGVTLDVPKGGMVSVLGRNGAGKTTLLRTVIGIVMPKSGSILFDGTDITHMKSHMRARQGISYVSQGREIMPDLTVKENLLLALLGKGAKANRVPEFVFEYFPALRDLTDRKGGVLSGGQQQQLAIARAIVQEPDLLLLDEPTEGLQPSVVAEIQEIIKRIHSERGCKILLVEQNLEFVREVTQQFALMENGQIFVQGEVGELTQELVGRYLSV